MADESSLRSRFRRRLSGWGESGRMNIMWQQWLFWRAHDRNYTSAVLSLLTVALVAAAMADQEWFEIKDGGCPLRFIGVSMFYQQGRYSTGIRQDDVEIKGKLVPIQDRTHFYFRVGRHEYVDCVTARMGDLFHGIIGVSFVLVLTGISTFGLELICPKTGFLRWLQRNAVFSIFSVILCVLDLGLAYWVAAVLDALQKQTSGTPDDVRVMFAEGFYLLVVSGLLQIGCVASTLFKSTRRMKEREDTLALADNMEDNEGRLPRRRSELTPGSTGPPPPLGMLLAQPPPPPYTTDPLPLPVNSPFGENGPESVQGLCGPIGNRSPACASASGPATDTFANDPSVINPPTNGPPAYEGPYSGTQRDETADVDPSGPPGYDGPLSENPFSPAPNSCSSTVTASSAATTTIEVEMHQQ